VINYRDYQARAIDGVVAHYRAGRKSVLLVGPTGSGKTVMLAGVAARHTARGGRVVWIAHRRELLSQAAAALRAAGVPEDRTVVTSAQTILARREAPAATLAVLDECHHYVARLWQDIPRAYGGCYLLGGTATPERADGVGLAENHDAVVVAAQIGDLITAGHLVACRVIRPGRLLGKNELAEEPWTAYCEHTPGSSAIVFAPHIKAADDYHAGFTSRAIASTIVTGTTPLRLRDKILSRLANGAVPVVINVGVLTEGFDCPRVKTIIVARGVGSVGAYLQMTGRALRPFPGSAVATLLDLRGVSWVLGDPTEDREFLLEGVGISCGAAAPALERLCRVCGLPLGDSTTCECGTEASQQETPHAIGEALSEWRDRYEIAKRQLRPTRASLALASIMRRAVTNSWKSNAIGYRFRGIFRRWPSEAEQLMARAVNRMAADDVRALEKYHGVESEESAAP
jgi:superfamily II DNA or RNA helicase